MLLTVEQMKQAYSKCVPTKISEESKARLANTFTVDSVEDLNELFRNTIDGSMLYVIAQNEEVCDACFDVLRPFNLVVYEGYSYE